MAHTRWCVVLAESVHGGTAGSIWEERVMVSGSLCRLIWRLYVAGLGRDEMVGVDRARRATCAWVTTDSPGQERTPRSRRSREP